MVQWIAQQMKYPEQAKKDGIQGIVYVGYIVNKTGKVESVEMHEYLVGSVAAEMSPLYHTEALKAQAVASYTYAVRTRLEQIKSPDSTLKGADISDSSQTHQG